MTEHTPGPWWIDDFDDEIEIVGNVENAERFGVKGDWTVATVDASETEAETLNPQANARLIAAAPELLEALEAIRDKMDAAPVGCHPDDMDAQLDFQQHIRDVCRAAIAKAKGEK